MKTQGIENKNWIRYYVNIKALWLILLHEREMIPINFGLGTLKYDSAKSKSDLEVWFLICNMWCPGYNGTAAGEET